MTAPAAGAARMAELTRELRRERHSKRELLGELARARFVLEVRAAGMDRVVEHNARLEAELRAIVGADAIGVAEDDLSVSLVASLRALGDSYGPLGVIRAALTILGAHR